MNPRCNLEERWLECVKQAEIYIDLAKLELNDKIRIGRIRAAAYWIEQAVEEYQNAIRVNANRRSQSPQGSLDTA